MLLNCFKNSISKQQFLYFVLPSTGLIQQFLLGIKQIFATIEFNTKNIYKSVNKKDFMFFANNFGN